MMIRCGVFVRQSDDPTGTELAVGRQWDEVIEKIITPRGWEPVRYCDNDKTAVGAKRSLPERDRMLRDVESGDLQAIAVWDCDRLYREPIDLEHIIAIADKHGTLLATVTGDIDLGTDNGRLFARIKGAVAKSETERRSARQKLKYRQLAQAGENLSPRRSFGRWLDGTLNAAEAPLLAQAYELVLAGHTPNSICTQWNKLGVLTSLGNEWRSPSQLTTILKNPRNAGFRSYNGEILTGDGKDWDPIVSRDVWQAVVDKLNDVSRRPVDIARKYELSSIALCDRCWSADPRVESTMKAARTSSKKAEPIYRCRTCFRVTWLVELVDYFIDNLVITRLSRPDAADLLVDQRHPDLDAKRAQAGALRERLRSQVLLHADGLIDDEQLVTGSARIKSQLTAIDRLLEDANNAALFRGVVGEDAHRFPELPLERRRAIINALMTIRLTRRSLRAPLDPNSIIVEWKIP